MITLSESKLSIGEKIPGFSLHDQNGLIHASMELKGRKALIYFYPKADTPGCTIQACSIRDSLTELIEHGITVLGVSPDNEKDQKNFDTKFTLGFPLLCDEELIMAKAFGVWSEKEKMGEKYMGIMRSAFLIEDGILTGVWYDVKPEDTVPNVLKML